MEGFPLAFNLSRIGVEVNPLCQIYTSSQDDIDHIFSYVQISYASGPKHTLPPLPLFPTLTTGLNSEKELKENLTMNSYIGTPISLLPMDNLDHQKHNFFNNK